MRASGNCAPIDPRDPRQQTSEGVRERQRSTLFFSPEVGACTYLATYLCTYVCNARVQQRCCTRRPRPLARAISDAIAAPAGGIMPLFEDHVEKSSPTLTLVIPRVDRLSRLFKEPNTKCAHIPCTRVSLSFLSHSPFRHRDLSRDTIFSSRIKFPREKTRYVARLFMSLTSYEFRARALLTSMWSIMSTCALFSFQWNIIYIVWLDIHFFSNRSIYSEQKLSLI